MLNHPDNLLRGPTLEVSEEQRLCLVDLKFALTVSIGLQHCSVVLEQHGDPPGSMSMKNPIIVSLTRLIGFVSRLSIPDFNCSFCSYGWST